MRTLFLTWLAAGAIALPAVAQTQAPQQLSVKKGQPVAVVYYRCEVGGGPSCEPHKGVKQPPVPLYYVHNGVALEDLPADPKDAWIKHVATYPTVDQAHFCSVEAAARATEEVKYCCKGSKDAVVSDNQWKAWVLVSIHDYTGKGIPNPPIAIMWQVTDGTTKVTHNGVFESFTLTGGNPITNFDNVPKKGGEGTLTYWHWVVPTDKQIVKGEDAGRIAQKQGDFELFKGSEKGKFDIKKID